MFLFGIIKTLHDIFSKNKEAEKIKRNKIRDSKENHMLSSKGWRVVRIGENELQRGDIRELLDVLGKQRPGQIRPGKDIRGVKHRAR